MAWTTAHVFGAAVPRTRAFGGRKRHAKTRATSLELVSPEDEREVRGENRPPVLLALPGGDVEQLLAFPLIEAVRNKCVHASRRRMEKQTMRNASRRSLEGSGRVHASAFEGDGDEPSDVADRMCNQKSWMWRGRAHPKPCQVCVWNQSQRSLHLRGRAGRRSEPGSSQRSAGKAEKQRICKAHQRQAGRRHLQLRHVDNKHP